jgi:hypothetical protein
MIGKLHVYSAICDGMRESAPGMVDLCPHVLSVVARSPAEAAAKLQRAGWRFLGGELCCPYAFHPGGPGDWPTEPRFIQAPPSPGDILT